MTHTPPARRDCTPAEAIAHALDDHWLTTPPSEPIYHHQAAEHVLAHLGHHGYTLYPAYRPAPVTRASLALTLLLATLCAIGTLVCTIRHEWLWAAASLLGTLTFTRELRRDLHTRRRQQARTR